MSVVEEVCANFDLLLPYLKSPMCSWNLVLKVLPVCPVYFILHVGQVSWYVPHLSYLFWAGLCYVDKSLSIVLPAVKTILRIVCLNSFVISLVSFPTHVNFAHFTFWVSCSCFFFLFLFKLLTVKASYLLLIRFCFILFLSFCRFWGVKLYVSILLYRYLIAAVFVLFRVAWVVWYNNRNTYGISNMGLKNRSLRNTSSTTDMQ